MKPDIMDEVLRDYWERLKRLENNIRAVYGGRDLLAEVDRLSAEKDEWARIAIAAQCSK